MRRTTRGWAAALLAAGLLLTACGGGGGALPDRYELGEDHLPAVNKLVAVPGGLSCETRSGGDGQDAASGSAGEPSVSYVYTGAEDAGALVGDYVSTLEEGYGCRVMDREGADAASPDFTAGEGEVVVGADGQEEGTLFALDIQWEPETFTVSPLALTPAAPDQEDMLTVEEAVEAVQRQSPARLGLEGEDMEAYSAVPEEGVVKVDDALCFTVNVYTKGDHQIAGTYLITADGSRIYRLDRETGQARPLS